MNKNFVLTFFILIISMSSFSQTARQQIDKAAKDPATKENAAKADVRLHHKKIMADTPSQETGPYSSPDKKKKKKTIKRHK